MHASPAVWRLLAACRTAFVLAIFFALPAGLALAQAPATVTITASPSVILADGQSTTIISAQVASGSDHAVPDGTLVRFSTTSGILSASTATTTGGVARVTLTSSPLP